MEKPKMTIRTLAREALFHFRKTRESIDTCVETFEGMTAIVTMREGPPEPLVISLAIPPQALTLSLDDFSTKYLQPSIEKFMQSKIRQVFITITVKEEK